MSMSPESKCTIDLASCKRPSDEHNISHSLHFAEDLHTLVQSGECSIHLRIRPLSHLITNVLCPYNNSIEKSLKDPNWATIQIRLEPSWARQGRIVFLKKCVTIFV